ncbi:hypothetical protein F2P56_014210 [Juglans regia]|uniref:Golgi SNAP receptor complex member 1 n=1 Tax=Juglans regia TaxID=51240 RepID=A0A834CT05_JUGRE|nr:hypothetical protein F2P56_014210 [Juglans regia]
MRIYILKSGYVDSGSPSVGSSRSWKSMEMEIQSLLEKLLDINDAMSRCAASAAPATSVTQKLARHRDILLEFTQEFRRIKGNINSMKSHAELLSSVRDDISEYKCRSLFVPLQCSFSLLSMPSEGVAECTGAARVLQHARAALLVSVLDVKSVVSLIAAAKPASTLLGMRRLESPKALIRQSSPPTFEKALRVICLPYRQRI